MGVVVITFQSRNSGMGIGIQAGRNDQQERSVWKATILVNSYSTFFYILVSNTENYQGALKGKFSSGIEGALASTLNHNFNWKQLAEMILCIFLLMFSKFI